MTEAQPTIYQKLLAIQATLKAPKSQYNSFGEYNYRSCEDILEALKPLLQTAGLTLTLSDEMLLMDGRYYVRATATLTDADGEHQIQTQAYAREVESKPKMDAAQITGSASSYARKYALNGMFLIDDCKDDDACPPSNGQKPPQGGRGDRKPTRGQKPPQNGSKPPQRGKFDKIKELKTKALALGIEEGVIKSYITAAFGKELKDFTSDEVAQFEKYLADAIADAEALKAGE